MNETLDLLLSHHSIRSYKTTPVSDAMLDQIIEAGYRGPTSINAQHISLVVVKDAARKAKIAELAGGQGWIATAPVFIAVVIDFNKTGKAAAKVGKKQIIQQDPEGLITSTFDAGITLTNMMIAARSLGLGIVPIGGIRRNPQAIIDLLKLPPLTFAVCGLCLGHVEHDSSLKPRLPISTFRHDETYNDAGFDAAIDAYDTELMAYWQSINRPDGLPWSANTMEKYQTIYYPEVAPTLKKQGILKD